MSMLDSFFSKGFKGAKCKTLLKLTIPRIKLLRNRREIQIKQMRRDIAKLLETGQEATARIRVEHIVREENMMAAQEILELFCELIAVRLPIIETQRECPIDLKEAISSVCFAAPRCADLPELLQVQMLFAAKYGKEFISAATELMPNCGVNRQLIELLSVRPPPPEKKMKLLKEIAEEHELDWDPAVTEEVFFKPHEDLLNGPMQFVSGSKLPLPDEKHAEKVNSAPVETLDEQPDSDIGFDTLDFPDVPKVAPRPNSSTASASESNPSVPDVTQPEIDDEPPRPSGARENLSQEQHVEPEITMLNNSVGAKEDRQFVPFISAPSLSSASFSAGESNSSPPPPIPRTKSDTNVDLQDVISAAQSAAETAERAAAAARSAASLAQLRISELTQKKNDEVPESGIENPFHSDGLDQSATTGKHHHINHQTSFNDRDSIVTSPPTTQIDDPNKSELSGMPSHGDLKFSVDSSSSGVHVYEQEEIRHPPQRLASMEDDPYFSYPNLFTPQNSNLGSGSHNSRSTQGH